MQYAKYYLMSNANAFGKLVAQKRQELNLSQRELAQRVGKSATYINYVERGYNPSAKGGEFKPGVEAVDSIAKTLKLNANEARIAAGYAPITAASEVDEETAGIFRDIDNLPPERKRIIKKQIRAIVDTMLEDEDFDFNYVED